jgi:hypothetical protein
MVNLTVVAVVASMGADDFFFLAIALSEHIVFFRGRTKLFCM